jgi:hypothetical protein
MKLNFKIVLSASRLPRHEKPHRLLREICQDPWKTECRVGLAARPFRPQPESRPDLTPGPAWFPRRKSSV